MKIRDKISSRQRRDSAFDSSLKEQCRPTISAASFVAFALLAATLIPATAWARFSPIIETIGYAIVVFVTFLMLLYCISRIRYGELVHSLRASSIFLFYLLASFFVIVFAHNGSGIGLMAAYAILGISFAIIFPLYFLQDDERLEKWATMLVVITFIVLLTAVLGVAGLNNLGPIPLFVKSGYTNLAGVRSSAGIFEQLTTFGLLIIFAIFSSLYLAKRRRNVLYLVIAGVFVLMLVALQSRAAILAFGVSMGTLLTFRRFTRRYAFSLPVFAGLLAITPFLLVTVIAAASPFLNQYLRLSVGLSGRDTGWLLAVSLISEKPLFGHGLGSSSEQTSQYAKMLSEGHFYAAGASFHNTFLTKAVDMGLIVASLYVLVYVVPLVMLIKSSMPIAMKRYLVGCLVAIPIVAFFVDINVGGARLTVFASAFYLGIGVVSCVYYPPTKYRIS